MEQLCEFCDNAGPLTVRGRCHPTAPLRIEIDNGFLNAFCYVPSCNRLVATLELAAGTESESAVFNAKLTAAKAEIERLRIACAGYNHTISRIAYLLCQPNEMGWSAYDVSQDELWVIEQVRLLRAERDALLNAGCIAMVPVAMKMKESSDDKA